MVKEQLSDIFEAIYWLYRCWKKVYLDLWKYFMGLWMALKVIPRGCRFVLEVIPEVEEWLIDSKKVNTYLIFAARKVI